MPFVQVLGNHTAAYDFDGNPVRPKNLRHNWDNVMLIVPANGGHPGKQAIAEELQKAKLFSQTFFSENLYTRMLCDSIKRLSDRPAVLGGCSPPCDALKELKKNLKRSPHWNLPHVNGEGKRLIDSWLSGRLSTISVDRVYEDIASGKFHCSNKGSTAVARHALPSLIQKDFAQLPEWMQVLAVSHGTFISTDYTAKDMEGTAGEYHDTHDVRAPYIIFINPVLYTIKEHRFRYLREELLHALHHSAYKEENYNRFIHCPPESDVAKPLGKRWNQAAYALARKMKPMADNPFHPAWQIIESTEATGGSLNNAIRNPLERSAIPPELLVDMVDAESHLLQAGHNAETVEKTLRNGFGDSIFDLYREYIETFMQMAAHDVRNYLGPSQADACLAKWRENPICHTPDAKIAAVLMASESHPQETATRCMNFG